MSYNLEFEKLGKSIKLELEAPVTVLEGMGLVTNSVFTKFEIEGEPMAEGRKLKYLSFFYASKSQRERIFCLHINDKDITKNVMKKLGITSKNSNSINLTLPEDIEAFYKETIVPLEAKAKEDYFKNKEIEKAEKNTRLIKLNPLLYVNYNTTYKYGIRVADATLEELDKNSMLEDIKIYFNNNSKVCNNDYFEEYLTDTDWGDYTISYSYKLTLEQLLEIKTKFDILIEDKQKLKAKKEEERKAFIDSKKAEAKEKNERIEINRWTEECNDPKEECNVDIVIEYVTPSGEFEIKRNHTW